MVIIKISEELKDILYDLLSFGETYDELIKGMVKRNKDEQIEELECLVGELNEYVDDMKTLIGVFRETVDNLKE